jgi:hypothetical protein
MIAFNFGNFHFGDVFHVFGSTREVTERLDEGVQLFG